MTDGRQVLSDQRSRGCPPLDCGTLRRVVRMFQVGWEAFFSGVESLQWRHRIEKPSQDLPGGPNSLGGFVCVVSSCIDTTGP